MTEGFDNWKYFKLRMQERLEILEERIHIRQRINTHPKLVVLIALLSGLMLLWVLVPMLLKSAASLPEETHRKVFFYDLNSKALFAADADAVPPIKAPSGDLPNTGGPAGVRAYVFRYPLSEGQENEPFIGWLETRDPSINKDVYAKHRTLPGPEWGKGMLVKHPEEKNWTLANTPEGMAIIESARKPDYNGRFPQSIWPE